MTRHLYATTVYVRADQGDVEAVQAVTALFAAVQDWPTIVPPWAMILGISATLLIGGLAGFYPAIRTFLLSPTEALATP